MKTPRFLAQLGLWRHWREAEKQATPWQARDRRTHNPDVAIGPPPQTGPTIAESSAPSSPAVAGTSDEEYARRAAAIRARRRGTRFYDGFQP